MITAREDVSPIMRKLGLPYYMDDAVERYLFDRIMPGGFLHAVIENNFRDAAFRADDENSQCLREWAMLLHDHFPWKAHGSPERFLDWISRKDMEEF
jgi:hypothetical protein